MGNIREPSLSDIPPSEGKSRSDDYYEDILSVAPEKSHNRWSVSWSDLMMTMFIFFTVMYVFQNSNKNISSDKGPGKTSISETGAGSVLNIGLESNVSNLYDQTRQAVSDVMMTGSKNADLANDKTVRIILAGDLLFDPGKADLKIGARYQLDQIAQAINENELAVNIVGHTDDSPQQSDVYPTNWELSAKRAIMVARYLTEAQKVDEKRIFISAHSSLRPIAPNDTARNRALNRRVEIILLKSIPNGEKAND